MNNDPQKVIDVSAGLVFRNGKLLITQRHADAHLGGLWEFPGGKRECDETFEQCLVRELREELAIEVEVGQRIDSVVHRYPEKTVRLDFFQCRWTAGEPQPLGCPAFQWIELDDLDRFQFPDADKQILHVLKTSPGLWM